MTQHDVTNEAHREACAECTTIWAELDAISAEARALPTLTPSRDLWAGIEARIEARIEGRIETRIEATAASTEVPRNAAARDASPARTKAARRWFAAPALRYAAAAAALIVTTATVTWKLAIDRSETPMVATGSPSSADPADAPNSIDDSTGDQLVRVRAAGYEEGFANMGLEIQTLQTLLDQRRSTLDSATIEIVERNLKLIDTAIAESRAAFLRDPASQFLASQLARSYNTKLTLLRATATMPMGT
jgi:hypothetical protein